MPDMDQPTIDFICIGVQRAATTWLAEYLRVRPQIWMPVRKELHYFSRDPRYPSASFLACPSKWRALVGTKPEEREWRRQFAGYLYRIFATQFQFRGLYGRVSWAVRYFLSFPKDDAWYRSLFREGKGCLKGEITPAYSLLEEPDIARMAASYPETRIILLLRNPLDRALSQLSFYQDKGWLPADLPEEQMLSFLLGPEVMKRSDYLSMLSRWSRYFGPDRFFVGWYDDFVEDAEAFAQDILRFIGLPAADNPVRRRKNPDRRPNCSGRPPVPLSVRKALAAALRPGLLQLAEQYGGHTAAWLASCDSLLAHDADLELDSL
jgi:hypothetical protein